MTFSRIMLALTVAVAGLSAAANANVALVTTVGQLQLANGDPLPLGSTIVILSDVGNDGIGDLTDPTTFNPGGDQLVARFPTDDALIEEINFTDAIPGSFTSPAVLDNIPVGPGNGELTLLQDIWIVWYATPYDAGATGPGEGVAFGFYKSSVVVDNNPGTYFGIGFLTNEFGGFNTPDDTGRVTGVTDAAPVVPEPGSIAIALAGLSLLGMRPSRRA